jgi:predicted molibdopterin-dependent oxidoreductase YjgC
MKVTWIKTTCSYCGLGCGLEVGVEDGKIVKIRGLKGHPTNDGDLCILPLNYPPLFTCEDRLKQPLIRKNEELEPSSWDEAISHVASKFKSIVDEFGSDSVAFYGGAINLTEEYYLMNKFMRGVIGTNNLECSTRLCMASTAVGFFSTIGADAPPTCYEDIEEADLFLIAGANYACSVPVLFRRIKRAKERNNAKLIVIDPRVTKTAELADYHLQLNPGTDVALNNAIAYVLIEEELVDIEFVTNFASGYEDLKEFVKDYSPSKMEKVTGCSKEQIETVARVIGNANNMLTFWLQGYNHSSQAVFKNNTLHNLSILTNNFCRVGAGPLSIAGEANAIGNRWVGALSHLLPGMRLVVNAKHRKEVAEFWNLPAENIKAVPGRSILDIIKGLHSGKIKALWIMTTNPVVSLPNTKWVKEGLKKTELLIVQDIFHPTETTEMADVVFAAAQWSEKMGTFISSERRINFVPKIIDPPGMAKPDYEIIWLVARAMGYESQFAYTNPEQVFEEFKEITRGRLCDMTGVTYERLKDKIGLQLPCPSKDHSGTKRLFTDWHYAKADGRVALLPRPYIDPHEIISSEYPFILLTGRIPFHFNTRTRTGRSPKLNSKAPDCYVELNPIDAKKINISENSKVEISSQRGSIRLTVHLTEKLKEGVIFIPWHYGHALRVGDGKAVNILTNSIYDIHSKQPEYKYTAVKIKNTDGGTDD